MTQLKYQSKSGISKRFFHKELNSKYFLLCGPYRLFRNSLTLAQLKTQLGGKFLQGLQSVPFSSSGNVPGRAN